MSKVTIPHGFALPEWAVTADLQGARACEKCSGYHGIVFHASRDDCPYVRKCIVCGNIAGDEAHNEIMIMGWPSFHDGEAVCVACIDAWLDNAAEKK